MVVRWGHTTVEQLRASLQMVNNQVVGAVFNQVDYEEHARRGYGDAVQFYMGSAAYYSDSFPIRPSLAERIRHLFTRKAA
jgi:polysaccharide biosynthesis transport protein